MESSFPAAVRFVFFRLPFFNAHTAGGRKHVPKGVCVDGEWPRRKYVIALKQAGPAIIRRETNLFLFPLLQVNMLYPVPVSAATRCMHHCYVLPRTLLLQRQSQAVSLCPLLLLLHTSFGGLLDSSQRGLSVASFKCDATGVVPLRFFGSHC